jgi:hypothetical protein
MPNVIPEGLNPGHPYTEQEAQALADYWRSYGYTGITVWEHGEITGVKQGEAHTLMSPEEAQRWLVAVGLRGEAVP